jgi:hypothetical protein
MHSPLRPLLLALVLALPRPASAQQPPPAVAQALAAFPAWDADQDQRLSLPELDRAIASPSVVGPQAAAAVALRRLARSKTTPIDDFTRDSITALAPTLRFADSRDDEDPPEPARAADPRPNLDRYYDDALRKIEHTPRTLFVGQPRLDGFRQGRLGTCFSLAPLTALAHADPAAIPRLFSPPAPDGSITVTFGAANSVTITPLTDGEIALGTATGGNGLWAATYEKAVGELRRSSSSASQDSTPYAVATRGGSAGTMLGVLTGRAITRFSCRHWLPSSPMPENERALKLDELRSHLRAATAEGRLITAGTSLKTRKVPSLSQNHAYAVLGYDPAADLVVFRDPHGQDFTPKGPPSLENGYTVRRGVFRAPLPEVVHLMAGFAFQQNEPVAHRGYPRADSAPAPTGPAS